MATKTVRNLPNGNTEVFYERDGFTFSETVIEKLMPAKDLDLQLKWIKETEIREDDVLICAFPKTGTHWTWEIVNMIQRGTAEYHEENKRSAMLEFSSPEVTSALSSPRVLNTHFTHNLLPDSVKRKQCKIISLIRNPKDVVVSLYFFLSKLQKKLHFPEMSPLDRYAQKFRTDVDIFCPYLWYLKHWEEFQNDNPDYPFLYVFYEDLKRDAESEIKKIATFLDKDLDDQTVREISEKCQFENMKMSHEFKKGGATRAGAETIYRKGIVGDWKNHLTVAESELYDDWIDSELKNSKIKFKFE